MRVLLANKFFYPHAGTETVLFHTRDLLESAGHTVIDLAMRDQRNVPSDFSRYFTKHRDYTDSSQGLLGRVKDAAASVYSIEARRRVRELVEDEQPDIAHLHGIYHQLSMSVVDELRRLRVPTVLTMHDYKMACPAYTLYRDGKPCSLCVTGPSENVVRHRCVKDSLAASLIAAAEARVVRQRHIYTQGIDVIATPSRFAAEVAIKAGADRSRVHVVSNFLPDSEYARPRTWDEDPPRFFFAGRLEDVKGVREMLDAFEGMQAGPELIIAGAGGDLADMVEQRAAAASNITFLGRISRERIATELRRSRAALVPSKWYENYPMSVLEARAAGVAVITTSMGGLPEMVTAGEDGIIVRAGDSLDLRSAVMRMYEQPTLARSMAESGHRRAKLENGADLHYGRLMDVYAAALTVADGAGAPEARAS